jgi:hypothetical protein
MVPQSVAEQVDSDLGEDFTHRTCGACFPNVQLGHVVTTRCGLRKQVRRRHLDTTCTVCRDMMNVFPCGPSCKSEAQ